jgi:hypothetical protein
MLQQFQIHGPIFITQSLVQLSIQMQQQLPGLLQRKLQTNSLEQTGEWSTRITSLFDEIKFGMATIDEPTVHDFRNAFGSKLSMLVLDVFQRATDERALALHLRTYSEEYTEFHFFKREFLDDPFSRGSYSDRIPDGEDERCLMVPTHSEQRSSDDLAFNFNIASGASPHNIVDTQPEGMGQVKILIPELGKVFPGQFKHARQGIKRGPSDGRKVRMWVPVVQDSEGQPYVDGMPYHYMIGRQSWDPCSPEGMRATGPFYALKGAIITRLAWDQVG